MRSKGKKQSTKTSFNSENAQPSDYLSHAEFSESDIEVAITNFHDSDSPLTLRSPQKVAKKISFADSNSSQKTQSIGIPDIQPIVFGQNSIPRRISLFKNSFQNSHSESEFSERDDYSHTTQEILAEHLVQPDGLSFEEQFGSISHNLIGGAITRDIYKWQEDNELKPLLRTRSHPELAGVDQVTTALAIREPGGFRRHFITRRNERQGRNPPNFMTKNFMDFLVLYGFYGGDITPEDDDSDLDDNDNDGDELEASVEENRPLLNHQQSRRSLTGTSESKAFFMLLKAFVGTGVLFLPKAFLNGGLIFSILTMIVLGYLTTHCMLLLVECSRSYGGKSFGELGELIYGSKFKTIILFSIAVSQMGFCAAYFIFVGQNLRDLLMLSTNCKFILPDWVFILFQILIQIPLSWVRKLKRFGISSLVADVFILLGLAYIFSFNASVIYEKGAQPITLINLQSFPLFIGTAMFSFEGICLVLPIAESMKHPEKFTRVVNYGMLVVLFTFTLIGSLGYLALGEKVETNIFLNLPTNPAAASVQFFYAIAIMLSFPLMVYPAIRIIEGGLFGVIQTGKSSNLVKWEKNSFRAMLVILLGFTAWFGASNLDKVVALVGCLCCIPLSFIYPAMFHAQISKSKCIKYKDYAIVVFGIICTIYSTGITLQQFIVGSADIPLDRCAGVLL